MLSNSLDIIYESTKLLDNPLWTATQYVGTRLAHSNRVLFVEPNNVLKMTRRALRGEKIRLGLRQEDDNLCAYSPPRFLPQNSRYPFLRILNSKTLLYQIKRAAEALGLDEPVLWLHNPSFANWVGHLNESLVVYQCDGELAHLPDFQGREEDILAQERDLLQRADLVFCTSGSILERKKRWNKHVHQVRLGLDADLFIKQKFTEESTPGDLADISSPRIGFVGAIDSYKVDFDLISYAAAHKPEWSFVLIGKTGTSDETTQEQLPQAPNIHYMGFRKHSLIPHYLHAFDVCVIPYVLNEYTLDLTTLKLFEYMASGKPIVTTNLPQLVQHEGLIRIARSKEEFVAQISDSLNEDSEELSRQRIALACRHSWENQVHSMLDLVHQRLAEKR